MNIFSSLHGNKVNQFWILAFLAFRLDPRVNALQSAITLGPKFKGQLLMHSIENKVSTSKIHEKLTAVHKMRLPRYGSTLRQHQEHLVLYIHNKVSSSGKKKNLVPVHLSHKSSAPQKLFILLCSPEFKALGKSICF